MMTIDDFIIHSTIRIQAILPNDVISTGTGFFYTYFNDEEEHVPVVVTNKHVVANALKVILIFSVKKNGKVIEQERFACELNKPEQIIIGHPDANVDLCIIPIAQLHKILNQQDKQLYYTSLNKQLVVNSEYINENLSNIEDITVVGYPDGIWDSTNNLPIVRKGITATSLKYNFNNAPEFLIDCAIFNGSSGSPVYIFNQGSYNIKDTLYAGNRLIFVGIVYAVAQHTAEGEIKIVLAPTAKTKPISITQIPNNIGVVIKATKLFDFEELLREKLKLEK